MKRKSSVNTFLVEIIIVILFFSLCVGITLQLFVAAHQKNKLNQQSNMALIVTQTKAEEFKGIKNDADFERLYQDVKQEKTKNEVVYQFFYDENWNETDQTPFFLVEIAVSRGIQQQGELLSAKINAKVFESPKQNSLCSLQAKKYIRVN